MLTTGIRTQGVQLQVELSLPMHKLWKALLNMEQVAPHTYLSQKLLKGNLGEVGSVHLRELTDGRIEKERVDSVDVRTHTIISTVISLGAAKSVHRYMKTIALLPAQNGTTTIARWRVECPMPPEGATSPMNNASEYALLFFKALETYLSPSSLDYV